MKKQKPTDIAAAYCEEKAKNEYLEKLEADYSDATHKFEEELDSLKLKLGEIMAYLVFRCRQTCKGREKYAGKLKHEPDCPAYDLNLVD